MVFAACLCTIVQVHVSGAPELVRQVWWLSDQSLSKIAHTYTHARVRCESRLAHQRPYAIQNAWHSVQAVV